MDSAWRRHARYIFILTSAGKPVWASHSHTPAHRHTHTHSHAHAVGHAHAAARAEAREDAADVNVMFSLINAILARTDESGDPLRFIRTPSTTFVFQRAGPIYLVMVQRTGDTLSTCSQILTHMHAIVTMRATNRLELRLRERPNTDIRSHVEPVAPCLQNLSRISNRMPSIWLDALPVLSLSYAQRQRIASALTAAAGKASSMVYAIIIAGYSMVAWAQTRSKTYALRPRDANVLIHMVNSTHAISRSSGTIVPLCMPQLDPSAILNAYVCRLGTSELQPATLVAPSREYAVFPPFMSASTPPRRSADDRISDVAAAAAAEHTVPGIPGVSTPRSRRTSERGSAALTSRDSPGTPDASLSHHSVAHDAWRTVESPADATARGEVTAESPAPTGPPLTEISRDISTASEPAAPSSPLAAARGMPPWPADAPTPPAHSSMPVTSDPVPSVPLYHPDTEAPGIYLVLMTADSGSHLKVLLDIRRDAIAAAIHGSDALSDVHRALSSAGPVGVGDYAASQYGLPAVLHFIYVWKPIRQYTMSRMPSLIATHVQRKALLRSYQYAYDKLTLATPILRHYSASFTGMEGIAHIAGIHTTNAIVLAALDGSVMPDRVPSIMEKLAKLVRRDHDRLLVMSPSLFST